MAWIRDFTVTEFVATAATWIPYAMPEHQSGDLLVAFLAKDSTTGWTQSTGWTEYIDQATAQANVGCQCIRATSSSETFSVTLTTETGVLVILAIADVFGTTLGDCLNVAPVVAGADATTIPYAGITGQSTTQDNCLILYAFGADGGIAPTAYAPAVNLYSGDATNGSLGVAYSFQKTAGSIPEVKWFGRGNDDGRAMLIAVRSNGSGGRLAYSDPSISSGQVLRPLVGLSTMQSDTWPTSVTITALGSDFPANSVYIYEVAPSYTDVTSAANSPTTGDVTWPIHIGDMMYFGNSTPFATLGFITSTAGVTGVVVWEYYNGAWVTAPGMSGAFTALGGARVAFTSEKSPTDWTTNDPGMGQTKYWVRCKITTAYTVAAVQSQCRLNGFVTAYIVATVAADAGTNPYCDATQDAGASSTANLSGCQINFGAALDMDTGIIVGVIRPVLPRDFAIDIPLSYNKAGGIQISLFDTNNNCLSYKLGAKACKTLDVTGGNVYIIDWNGSATPWAICGTINKSAVTRVHLTTYGYYGASAIQWSMLNLVTVIGMAGGSSGSPLTFTDIEKVMNYSIGWFPFFKRMGNAVLLYAPLQIGGGDPIYININLRTFQFPTKYDGIDYFDWNAADNVAGIKFYPKSGDVIKFTNCVFTSDSPYRFEFDASSSSDAIIDFNGTSVVGATVTFRAIDPFIGMLFINCPSFTQNGATIQNCTFLNTKVSSASPSDADNISSSSFTSGGTGHAIEIGGTAADMVLSGVTFSGYSGTSTNAAIYVNIASGTMTINITNNGDTPSIRTAGATVNIVNARIIRVTAKDAATGSVIQGAKVALWATTGTTVTITRIVSTAYVAHTAHGYSTEQKVTIFGAEQGKYNGIKTITVTGIDEYTYTVSGTPTTPATGTITSNRIILDGITNASGIVEDTTFPYVSDLNVTGRVRKGSTSIYYKTSPLSGTITGVIGFDVITFLVSDE